MTDKNPIEINGVYARKALENRSMFRRDFTVLLMYFASRSSQRIDGDLTSAYQAVGKARFTDLFFKLPAYYAKKELKGTTHKLSRAFRNTDWSSLLSLTYFAYRLVCVPLTAIAALLMFPVNMAYGALDWLGLQGALAYFEHSTHKNAQNKLNRATYVSLAISIVTLPIRLAFGLIEALQEPLHLYDFWIKGAVDAYHERKNHETSKPVYAAKLFLHGFKVICTLGAVLSIVGITAIPFISKGFDYLGKVAYAFIGTKELIPYHKYIFDMPLKGLQHSLVGVETGFKELTGVHYSHMSQHTNAKDAIKLGFESALTKGAGLLPMERNYRPIDLKPS